MTNWNKVFMKKNPYICYVPCNLIYFLFSISFIKVYAINLVIDSRVIKTLIWTWPCYSCLNFDGFLLPDKVEVPYCENLCDLTLNSFPDLLPEPHISRKWICKICIVAGSGTLLMLSTLLKTTSICSCRALLMTSNYSFLRLKSGTSNQELSSHSFPAARLG